MGRIGTRILGSIGGATQLFATLLPFYSRGSVFNDDFTTRSLLAVSPWLGMANVVLALLAVALALSGNGGLLWIPIAGTLVCLTLTFVLFKPPDYAASLGVWGFFTSLLLLVFPAAWRSRRPVPVTAGRDAT